MDVETPTRAPLATYTLELYGPEVTRSVSLAAWLRCEIEENVTDLLPPGFRITIKEWDSDEHD